MIKKCNYKIKPREGRLLHPYGFPKEYIEMVNKNIVKKRQMVADLSSRSLKKNSLVNRFHKIYSEITSKKLNKLTNSDIIFEQQYYNKAYVNEYLNCFYALFSVVMSIVYEEYRHSIGDNPNFIILPFFISLFSVFLWVNIIIGEIICLDYDKKRDIFSSDSTLYTSGRWKRIIAKLTIFFFHPNPFTINYNVTIYYIQVNQSVTRNINTMFTVICFFRIYYLFRFLLYTSKYMEPSSDRLYKSFHFNSNYIFSIKAYFQAKSLQTYLTTILILVISMAYLIRIFEKEIQPVLGNYYQSLWYMLITQLTVGYGDLVAKSDEGRIFSFIACVISILMLSLLTISVSNLMNMSQNEKNCLKILDIVSRNQDREDYSKKVIGNFLKMSIKSNGDSVKNIVKEQTSEFIPLKKAIRNFQSYEDSISSEIHSKPDNYVLNSLILCVNKEFEDLDNKQSKLLADSDMIKEKLMSIMEKFDKEERDLSLNEGNKESSFETHYPIIHQKRFSNLMPRNADLPVFTFEQGNNENLMNENEGQSISVISDKTESQDLNFNVKNIVKLLNKNN